MKFNRLVGTVFVFVILIITTAAGCQQLSKIIKPKSSSSLSSSASSTAITNCKFVSLWATVLYGNTDSRLFTMLNVPVSFNGLSFSGHSSNVFDYCNSHGAGNHPNCVKSYDCTITGMVSQDKKTLEKVTCSIRIIIDDESGASGTYEIAGIPFKREEDFRKVGDSGNFHSYYELLGTTVAPHVLSLDMTGYNKKVNTQVKKTDLKWEGNAGFQYVFKLLNNDVN